MYMNANLAVPREAESAVADENEALARLYAGQSLTQMTTNAAKEQLNAITGPRTESQTTPHPTRFTSSTARAPRRLS